MPSYTGTMTATGDASGLTVCECCCPSHVTCTSNADCAEQEATPVCAGGCCTSDFCGGCPECTVCVGSGEDVECAFCPPSFDNGCLGEDTATHPECADSDIDGNGVVDFLDFAYFNAYCDGCEALRAAGMPQGGPGTEMTAHLKRIGFKACPLCRRRARQMDAWGAKGCREHFDEIVRWLHSSAPKDWRGVLGKPLIPALLTAVIRTAERKGY